MTALYDQDFYTWLYDQDFYTWTQHQAAALRAGRLSDLDLANLAEEIEDMGRSQRDKLESHLAVLLAHLLKHQHQPGKRTRSWELTIKEQRRQVAKALRRNPGLKSHLDEAVADAYDIARLVAARETGLSEAVFPEVCPWGWEAITDENFLPD